MFLAMLLFVAPSASFAQESRPDDAQQTTEPAETDRIVEGRPALYSVKRVAHPLTWVEMAFKPIWRSADSGWIQKLIARKPATEKTSGVRYGVDGMGSGSGFGPQVTLFHKDFLGRGIDVQVPLLYTFKRYQMYQFRASVPMASETFVKRLSFDFGAGYSSRAQDSFFGIGNESSADNETQFRTVTREASAGLTAKINDEWASSVRTVYQRVGVTKPTVGLSTQQNFDNSSVPGLFGATLGSLVFSIGRDNQTIDNKTFKGGSDQLEISFNDGLNGDVFRYWRYRLDSQHFIWLTNDGRKLLALRGLVETNRTSAGHDIPFFEMPVLGTRQTLRGFDNFRFRDKTAAALSLEYRYRIWSNIDFGLFVDEGQVAPQLGDLALSRFHTGYGARLFFWPKATLPISIDYGRSGEQWRVYLSINPKF
jgi:Omp85 superfamily domain